MLWYSWSGQRWSNLHWSAPRYALLTFADNTALPEFLYLYTCSLNVSLHRIIIYINFPLIYAIWWPLTVRSYLCMNGWHRRAFFFSTHTEACVTSQWGHKHTNNISRTALRVTAWACHHFIGVKLSSYHTHRNVKVFTATRQNKKSGLFEDSAAEIFVSNFMYHFISYYLT